MGRLTALVSVLLVSYAGASPIAWSLDGVAGLVTAAVAATFCLAGGALALVVGEIYRGAERVLHQVLLGTALRMGVPLGLCVAVYWRDGFLVDAGLAYYLIGFYLVMLTVETVLMLPAGPTKTP